MRTIISSLPYTDVHNRLLGGKPVTIAVAPRMVPARVGGGVCLRVVETCGGGAGVGVRIMMENTELHDEKSITREERR